MQDPGWSWLGTWTIRKTAKSTCSTCHTSDVKRDDNRDVLVCMPCGWWDGACKCERVECEEDGDE